MTRAFPTGLACLLACAVLAWPQRPSEEEAGKAIEQSRQKSLDYARSLPDFVCTEVVHRYTDRRNRGAWLAMDKLAIKLSYFEQKEDHKLLTIDGKPSLKSYEQLDGAIGVGEFGGTLHSIFDPASQASFRWQGWKTLRKHRVAVYSYTVEALHSHYLIATGSHTDLHQSVVGFHGMVEIDSETGAVLHFTYEADQIPKDLQMTYALTTVDYDFAMVGGREYLLPSRSQTEMRSPGLACKNEIEFRDYGKFSAESSITFGDGK